MRPDALLAASDMHSCDRMRVRRTAVLHHHRPHFAEAREMSVMLHNISRTGLLFEAPMSNLRIGQTVDLDLQHGDSVESEIVWSDGRFYGCQFTQPVREDRAGPETPGGYHEVLERGAAGLVPERSFLTAIVMALGLWALIGTAIYLVV